MKKTFTGEIRIGKNVAYGEVGIEAGETVYALESAPTQADFDAVAAWLEGASAGAMAELIANGGAV